MKCYVCKNSAIDPVFCKDGRVISEDDCEDDQIDPVEISCHCVGCVQEGHRHCDECNDCVPVNYVHLPCGHCDYPRIGRDECYRCVPIVVFDASDADDDEPEWGPTCSVDAK